MTGTLKLNQGQLTAKLLIGQHRTKRLLKILTRTIVVLLLTAFLLTAALAMTKQMLLFYAVSEESITVTAGNTLWGIADEHIGEYPGSIRSYMAEISRLNGLEDSNHLPIGTKLTIPVYHYKLR